MTEGRRAWMESRKRLEERLLRERCRSTPDGVRGLSPLYGRAYVISWAFRAAGLYGFGLRNAGRPRLNRLTLAPRGLPPAFDGFTLLYLSDLHIDLDTGVLEPALELLRGETCDIAVFGGDFQSFGRPSAAEVAAWVAPLVDAIQARQGIFAVLGNHDRHDVVEPLEALGMRFLINESMALERDGQYLGLIGCDDVHAFHDKAALQALRQGRGCRIALVHSPDLAREAAAAGCALYLAGHTHGGQVCPPSGKPILTAMDRDHHLASGVWRQDGMVGYTSNGLGCGGSPIRFNCPPEVVLITLRCTA